MENINQKIENSIDFFMLASKECGFDSIEDIEANFNLIVFVASEMVKYSKERILTKLASSPNWIKFLAAKYRNKVLSTESH